MDKEDAHETHDRLAWLYGSAARCDPTGLYPSRPFRMVLIGPPGVGKGTQAALLRQAFEFCPLSTGDVFRAAKELPEERRDGALRDALGCMARGELVPDETVVAMVKERVNCLNCPYGFLLDGFPRTVSQAEALEGLMYPLGLALDVVISYALTEDEAVRRLSGRRTCQNCRATYHMVSKPPKVAGICTDCGGELYQREDDQPESIRIRLATYRESVAPLLAFYERKRLLITVSAEGDPDEIFTRTLALLEDQMVRAAMGSSRVYA